MTEVRPATVIEGRIHFEIVRITNKRVRGVHNAEGHDPPAIDISPVAAQESTGGQWHRRYGRSLLPRNAGAVVTDVGVSSRLVSPGRSAIRRNPRARRRCGSRHNNRGPWSRPLSRGLAGSWSNVVGTRRGRPDRRGGERRGRWGLGMETSGGFQSSGNVSPSTNASFARPGRVRDVNLQTGDCELN